VNFALAGELGLLALTLCARYTNSIH